MIRKKSLLLAVATLALVSLTSCIEEPQQGEDTPAKATNVQSELRKAWGDYNPLTMEVNDFLYTEMSQTLETNTSPFFLLQEGVTVSEIEDIGTDWNYKFLYQTKSFKNGEESSQATREYEIPFKKEESTLSPKTLAMNSLQQKAEDFQLTFGIQYLLSLMGSCEKPANFDKLCKQAGYTTCKLECLNLNTESLIQDPPELIKNQTNCGGLKNCQLHIKKVSFDRIFAVTKGQNTESQRINFSISLSQDLPFLARVTQYCARQLYPVNNQKVLVNTCVNLKNFKKGSP